MNSEISHTDDSDQNPESGSRIHALRGGLRPSMMQQGGGAPPSEEEERLWDKKEDESRAKIKERYDEVIGELKESKDKILEIINEAEVVFAGRINRIDITYDEVEGIFESIRQMNCSLGKTKSLFDAYVHFARSTPDLQNINGIIYNFNRFLVESQERPFFVLWSQEGKYYFGSVKIKNYANSLSFLIERIIGALTVAGNYVIDVPKVHHNTQQRYDGMGGSQLGGMNRFNSGYPNQRFQQGGVPALNNNGSYLNNLYNQSMKTGQNRNLKTDPLLEEIRRMKTIEKSGPRDFGDEQESYEGA